MQRRPVRAVSLTTAIAEQNGIVFGWEPNWIDYRHSRVIADKRSDAGDETLEICAHCGCEADITPAPHSPKCKLTLAGGPGPPTRICVEDGCDDLVASKYGERCPVHAAERQRQGRQRFSGSTSGAAHADGAAVFSQREALPGAVPPRDSLDQLVHATRVGDDT